MKGILGMNLGASPNVFTYMAARSNVKITKTKGRMKRKRTKRNNAQDANPKTQIV